MNDKQRKIAFVPWKVILFSLGDCQRTDTLQQTFFTKNKPRSPASTQASKQVTALRHDQAKMFQHTFFKHKHL